MGILLAGFALVGCMVSPVVETAATAVAPRVERRTLQRTVALHRAARRPADVAAARTARTAAPPAPAPWARFEQALLGPTFAVAHARAPLVPVAATMDGPPVATLADRTKIGAPRVFLVVAEVGEWLQVLLPLRPNSSVGWIRRSDVDLSTTSWRVEIDRAAHRLRVFDAESVVLDETVAVGQARTPTPAGQFFVTELLRVPNPGGSYGPFAFTLSAYSPVFQRFGSGDGAVGIHGTNAPGLLGTDASHGCVRLSNEAIHRLAELLPLGTPVLIR